MFNNSFNLKSSIGYGDSAVRTTTYSVIIWPYIIYYTVTSQYVDVFTVPADIANQSWTGFGANLGGGITFNLSRGFSLVAEARYYYCPKKELNFAVSSGSYNGALDNLKSYALSATTMDALVTSGAMSKMSVNPSFIRAAFGLRISFGKN
jgi:opacity protein-like surface antigen